MYKICIGYVICMQRYCLYETNVQAFKEGLKDAKTNDSDIDSAFLRGMRKDLYEILDSIHPDAKMTNPNWASAVAKLQAVGEALSEYSEDGGGYEATYFNMVEGDDARLNSSILNFILRKKEKILNGSCERMSELEESATITPEDDSFVREYGTAALQRYMLLNMLVENSYKASNTNQEIGNTPTADDVKDAVDFYEDIEQRVEEILKKTKVQK